MRNVLNVFHLASIRPQSAPLMFSELGRAEGGVDPLGLPCVHPMLMSLIAEAVGNLKSEECQVW